MTVGIDIGTSSVKAIAADDDGNVVASSRVPHELPRSRAPQRFEHDADVAWRRGTVDALAALGRPRRQAASASRRWFRRSPPSTRAGCPSRPGCSTATSAAVPRAPTTPRREPRSSANGWASCAGTMTEAPGAARLLARAGGRQPRAVRRGDPRHDHRGDAYPLFDWTGWDEEQARRRAGCASSSCPRSCPPAGKRRARRWRRTACSRAAASTRSPSSSSPAPTRRATCS